VPTDGGGVPGVARIVLAELADAGLEIDCYTTSSNEELPACLLARPNLRVFRRTPAWSWDRWYSSADVSLTTLVSLQLSRAGAQLLLARSLAARHRTRAYDVVYQFSQIELLGLRLLRARLPPIVLHPQVHAAGELRWLRAEENLSRRCEPRWRHVLAITLMRARAAAQRRDMPLAARVIAPSALFGRLLVGDYGVAPERIRMIADPVDLERFHPDGRRVRAERPTILFVARLAVRKGVDTVVELSHRLAQAGAGMRLVVVGHPSLWSDYRRLLGDLHPEVGEFRGELSTHDVAALMRECAVLLVPSRYEPFGLTAAEALASGLAVVASDAVGATEEIGSPAVETFAAGDTDAAERALHHALGQVQRDPEAVRKAARQAAEERFSPAAVAAAITCVLEEAAAENGRRPHRAAF
jgi:glycosyltransferase involved in cell wall biosynthesis